MLKKLMLLPEKYGLWMALGWMTWHWGLLAFGLLPYPQPRLAVMTIALSIDGLCFIYFFTWYLHRVWRR